MIALKTAKAEEEARRKESYKNFIQLQDTVIHINITNVTKQTTLNIIDQDYQYLTNLSHALQNFTLFPALKYNKLLEIFNCAGHIIKKNFNEAISGNLTTVYPLNPNTKTILYGTKDANNQIINYFGTGWINCMQNAYFFILRAANQITNIKDLSLKYNIYDIDISSNIQTTKLPDDFNSISYHSWFYYYQDNKTAPQGEIATPHLGYIFGGSRYDERYKNKQWRAEDCSSAVTKWINSEISFSTSSLLKLHTDTVACNADSWCVAAQKVLIPVAINTTSIHPGMIFCYRGHTGVVTNNYPEINIFETLSYSREIPDLEGLGYKNYSYSAKQFYFFIEKPPFSNDQNLYSHEEL